MNRRGAHTRVPTVSVSAAPPVHHARKVILGGLVIASFAGSSFLVYDALRHDHSSLDVSVTGHVQAWSAPWLDSSLSFINELTNLYPAVAIWTVTFVVLFLRGLRVEAFILLLVAMAFFGAEALGNLVVRPRPSPDLIHVPQALTGNGFPSGHVLGAVVFYGLMAWFLWQRARRAPVRTILVAAAAFIVAMAGVARVYLGVHWPGDVLGGLLLGSMALSGLLWAYTRMNAGCVRFLGLQFDVTAQRRARLVEAGTSLEGDCQLPHHS